VGSMSRLRAWEKQEPFQIHQSFGIIGHFS
jgi:hypothetical protein